MSLRTRDAQRRVPPVTIRSSNWRPASARVSPKPGSSTRRTARWPSIDSKRASMGARVIDGLAW